MRRQSGGAFVGSQTSKGKNEPISPDDRGFGAPCQLGRGSSGSVRHPRGLRKRLHAARDMAGCLPAQGRDYAPIEPTWRGSRPRKHGESSEI